MSVNTFLILLLIISTLTGLVVEGIKKLLTDINKAYKSNILAGEVSVVVSAIVAISYVAYIGAVLNAQLVVMLIALVLLSWLCSMVGYDKVVQTIAQIRGQTDDNNGID